MIHDKGRLDQFFLTELLEEEVDDITFLVAFLVCNVMLLSKFLCCCIICYGIKVDSGIFFNRIVHGHACKWLAKVDLDAIVADLCTSADFFCKITEHGLCQFHHALIVCVCLIQLHQCELRVMTGVNTLIAEYTADLVYTLKSADDQSL